MERNPCANKVWETTQFTTTKDKCKIDYFDASQESEAKRDASAKITEKTVHNELKDLFSDFGFFESTFSSQVKEGSKHPIKEWLEHLRKQQITILLGVDEMSELCKSIVLVPWPMRKYNCA